MTYEMIKPSDVFEGNLIIVLPPNWDDDDVRREVDDEFMDDESEDWQCVVRVLRKSSWSRSENEGVVLRGHGDAEWFALLTPEHGIIRALDEDGELIQGELDDGPMR